MTDTRDPSNPVWLLLKILRADLRVADLAEACPSELAELQEQLEHWAGVVAARRRDLGQGAAAPAAALSHNAHWPDALERPLPPLEMSA